MRTLILAALLVLYITAATAGPKKKPQAPAPTAAKTLPVVTQELKLKLWRAEAEADASQLALERSKEMDSAKRAAYQKEAAMKEWQDFCGTEFATGFDKEGHPSCVDKPKPAEPPQSAPAPGQQSTPVKQEATGANSPNIQNVGGNVEIKK